MDKASIIDSAWKRAEAVSNVRKVVSSLPKVDRLAVLMQIVAEDYPDEAPVDSPAGEKQPRTRRAHGTSEDIAERKERILKVMTTHEEGMTVNEICRKTKLWPHACHYALPDLVREGKVERLNKLRWRKAAETPAAATKKKPKNRKSIVKRKKVKSNSNVLQLDKRSEEIGGRRAAVYQFIAGSKAPVSVEDIMKTIPAERTIIQKDTRLMEELKMLNSDIRVRTGDEGRAGHFKVFTVGRAPFNAEKISDLNTKIQNGERKAS